MPEPLRTAARIMAAVWLLLYGFGYSFWDRLLYRCLAPSQKAQPNRGIQSIPSRTAGGNPRFARAFASSGRDHGSGLVSFVCVWFCFAIRYVSHRQHYRYSMHGMTISILYGSSVHTHPVMLYTAPVSKYFNLGVMLRMPSSFEVMLRMFVFTLQPYIQTRIFVCAFRRES